MSIKVELLTRRGQHGTRAYFAITPYIQLKWGYKEGYYSYRTREYGSRERAICICWLFWSIRTTITTRLK